MPRDSLLARLALTPHWDPDGKYMYQALMAVLDIHKPSEPRFEFDAIYCQGCTDRETIDYPCRTIRAIETILS